MCCLKINRTEALRARENGFSADEDHHRREHVVNNVVAAVRWSDMSVWSVRDEDDEEALRWVAIEKLPTYDHMRKGILTGPAASVGGGVGKVNIQGLGMADGTTTAKSIHFSIYLVVHVIVQYYLFTYAEITAGAKPQVNAICIAFHKFSFHHFWSVLLYYLDPLLS